MLNKRFERVVDSSISHGCITLFPKRFFFYCLTDADITLVQEYIAHFKVITKHRQVNDGSGTHKV